MPIVLARERISDVASDVAALAPAHIKEVTQAWLDPDDYELDFGLYEAMEPIGATRIFTAREDGKLVGYCGLAVAPRTTHTGTRLKWAHQDALYVLPEYRGPMVLRFLYYQDLSLESEGCNKILRHCPTCKPYDRLLLHMGYRYIDRGYIRDLARAS